MRTLRRISALLGGCAMLAAVAAGCGGGGGGLVNLSGEGTLGSGDATFADGSYYDPVTFRATRDGVVVITMEAAGSDPVGDPYILAFRPGQSLAFASDDDSGPGLAAQLSFVATSGVTYTIAFNTLRPGDSGGYRYAIREVDANGRAVIDEPGTKPPAAGKPIAPAATHSAS